MKIINSSSDLLLWRWNKIIESEKKGELDLRYLFNVENPIELPKDLDIEKLRAAYIDIISEFDNIDNSIPILLLNYKFELHRIELINEKNKYLSIINELPIKISYDKLSNLFNQYINAITQKYSNFKILEYQFINLPAGFEILARNTFYSITEYELFLYNNSYSDICLAENFLKKHLITELKDVPDLIEFEKQLFTEFKKLNGYELYPEIRLQLFAIENLQCEPIDAGNNNFTDELSIIQHVTNIRLTLKDNVLSEYFSAHKLAQTLKK